MTDERVHPMRRKADHPGLAYKAKDPALAGVASGISTLITWIWLRYGLPEEALVALPAIYSTLRAVIPNAPSYVRAVVAWMKEIKNAATTTFLAFLLMGCATTTQTITTADGDHYQAKGFALFSKQDVQAKGNLVVYPNASGLEFTAGSNAKQDATDAFKALVALGQLLAPISAQLMPKSSPSPLTPNAVPVPIPCPPITE